MIRMILKPRIMSENSERVSKATTRKRKLLFAKVKVPKTVM